MYDDGAHNDGLAGDHLYGANFPVNGLIIEYYIYADNNNAGLFSPARAEHEYHTLTVSFPAPNVGAILINEVLASNSTTNLDPNGQAEDWVELVNTTSAPIDLAGFYLSDDPMNLMEWPFPAGTMIPANGYLLVWADNDVNESGLHSNFKLSSAGEYVSLSLGLSVYDQVTFGVQSPDISYARCPDAGLNFAQVTPSPLAVNTCDVGVLEQNLQVQVYPNPFQDELFIDNQENGAQLQILDINGRVLLNQDLPLGKLTVPTQAWSSGLYIVQIEQAQFKQTLKIVK
jgi:hypothetical protein